MDGNTIQRILSVADAQENRQPARTFWHRCRDFVELLARAEAVMLVAVSDNVQRDPFADSGDVAPVGGFTGRALRRVRVENVVREELARLVDHGNLATGTQAGVDSEYGDGVGLRSEQEIFQVIAEGLGGIGVGSPL